LNDTACLEALLEEGGAIDGAAFLKAWKNLPQEKLQRLGGLMVYDAEAAKAKLQAANLFVLAHRPVSWRALACVGMGERDDVILCRCGCGWGGAVCAEREKGVT
jgi:hypothetical protein